MNSRVIAALAASLMFVAGVEPLRGSSAAAQDVPEYVAEALSPFGRPPDAAAVAEMMEEWRAERGPRTASERLAAAQLWRLAGDADAALAELAGVRDDEGVVGALARLERARVGFELGSPAERLRSAPREFWSACGSLAGVPADHESALAAEFWRDFVVLATPGEREAWLDADPAGRCDVLRAMLEERAFRMAVTVDERLALHYERLRVSRARFSLERPRFYVGMTHWHGRRDDDWLDDRGLVYLRMGRPQVLEACGGTFPGQDVFDADLLATCWVYERPEGYKLYHFSTVNKVTQIPSTSGGYYLQEHLGPRAHPADPFFQKYVRNSDLPYPIVRHMRFNYHLSSGGDVFDAALDGVEARHYAQALRVETRRLADEALVEVPDVPAVSGAPMLWEALRFQNPADGSWQVWVVASVPAGALIARRGGDTWHYGIRARLATRHADAVELDSAWNRAVTEEPLADDAGLPVRMFTVAKPGALPISLAVADEADPGRGAWALDTLMISRILPLPTVSDIAVARRDGGTWTRDGETFLRVSPDHVTNTDGSLHVYFEAYGMRGSAEYDVELRLVREGAETAFELPADEVAFRLGFRAVMPASRIGRHPLRLELGETAAGVYDLAIRITDVGLGTASFPVHTRVVVADRETRD